MSAAVILSPVRIERRSDSPTVAVMNPRAFVAEGVPARRSTRTHPVRGVLVISGRERRPAFWARRPCRLSTGQSRSAAETTKPPIWEPLW